MTARFLPPARVGRQGGAFGVAICGAASCLCRIARAAQDRWAAPPVGRAERGRISVMNEHVYKLVELVGTSGASVSDAIQNAITRAAATVRNIKWFEVVQVRGEVKDGKVGHYQVTLKVGFTLD